MEIIAHSSLVTRDIYSRGIPQAGCIGALVVVRPTILGT